MEATTTTTTEEQPIVEQPRKNTAKNMALKLYKSKAISGVMQALNRVIYIPVNALNAILKLLDKHTVETVFMIAFLAGAGFFHFTALSVMLPKVLPGDYHSYIPYVSLIVAAGLESLTVYLILQYNRLTILLELTILLTLAGIGVYEYNEKLRVIDIASRTGAAMILFLGLIAITRAIANKEYFNYRQDLELIQRKERKKFREIVNTCESIKIEIDSLSSQGTDDKILNDKKGNYKQLCKTYKMKATSFERFLVRRNMFSPAYFKQLPKRRKRKVS